VLLCGGNDFSKVFRNPCLFCLSTNIERLIDCNLSLRCAPVQIPRHVLTRLLEPAAQAAKEMLAEAGVPEERVLTNF
jgi:hypothetical protein